MKSTFPRFARAERGNVAMVFALMLPVLVTSIGAAIDYSRAVNARSAMQAAADATALMISKEATSLTAAQVTSKSQAYFSALFNHPEISGVAFSAAYSSTSGSGPTVSVTAAGSIQTDFMKFAGISSMPINASSQTKWGNSKLRVALALDNTGSMNDFNKIGALKTASQNLVSQLSALAQNNGDVYISVVPFEIDVNVGTANVGASWLRWDMWDPRNNPNSGIPWITYCNSGYWLTMAQCQGHGYTWNHTVGNPSRSQWTGCVSDRDQDYDVTSAAPGTTATNFPADQDQSCPVAAILPLTYNWSTVNNTINSMTAQGATNQTIGLQWAWFSLLQQAPLNAPAEPADGSTYQHIIVLFTDGLNTGNRWYGDFSNTSTQVDNRMKLLCDNIKATGVTIYTVQIDTDGAGQSAVLPYCASSSQNFFMLTSPGQIASAFSQIATSIAKLRVAG